MTCLYCPATATERVVYRDRAGDLTERTLCDTHVDGYLRTLRDLGMAVVGLSDVEAS